MESSINQNPKIIMFNSEQKELKKLPCGATKKQIFKMFPKESDERIRSTMHYVQIENNPHIAEDRAKLRHRLSYKEFKHFIELMGVPSGYTEEYTD